jgi:hypothetical protein
MSFYPKFNSSCGPFKGSTFFFPLLFFKRLYLYIHTDCVVGPFFKNVRRLSKNNQPLVALKLIIIVVNTYTVFDSVN